MIFHFCISKFSYIVFSFVRDFLYKDNSDENNENSDRSKEWLKSGDVILLSVAHSWPANASLIEVQGKEARYKACGPSSVTASSEKDWNWAK